MVNQLDWDMEIDFKGLFAHLKEINYNKNLISQIIRSKNNHILEINRNIDFIKIL